MRDSIWLTASAAVLAIAASGCGGVPLAGRSESHVGSFFWAREQEGPPPRAYVPLIVADFNRSGHRTNAGKAFGGWDFDPGDATQFCRIRLVESERVGSTGFGLMVDYDVDSPNPAFNGFWMKLSQVAIPAFDALTLSIKGDAQRGFTRRVWIELKGKSHTARYQLDGIEAHWKRIRIPLREFEGIRRLREATELVFVFEDETVTEKVGTLYLDNIVFEPAA